MPTFAARTAPAVSLAFRDILSDDGTRLRAWTNDPDGVIDGPTVVLCNGLGTNPYLWPALMDPACGVRVVSWNHRGVGGSDRPVDPSHVAVEHFVEDGLSVMDHFGIDQAVLMGWSIGVNTMFELAARNPERVSGLFAVAGVPGDTFSTMLAPLRLPRPVARALTVNVSRVLSLAGKAVTPISTRLPIGPRAIAALTHSGFMLPVPDPALAAVGIKEFLTTPVDWYFHLALCTSRHARVRLSTIDVPAMFVAGRWDVLAGARDMASAAARMSDAEYVELWGSHFIQVEQPDVVHQLLLDFLDRVGAASGV
ncbi:alpha/beta fold hydrolase [Nocardioides sp. R-C-SC26]|uniref:alpha/beta fold hydrolase n=1 Tax=Nocardioides sp. R-C-SC26 TaxID=2870414 RepID=UPI001E4BADEE|nr:alpha/beta hydrolase [Nocardioides sp. R-C-SC26]